MRLSLALTAAFASVLPAFGAACDRACLKSSLDQYLQAVLKHDPQAAPLFLGYRHTENALLVKLGEGAWKSVTSIGKVDRRYYDPVSGQAAFFGVLNEGDEPTVTTVRIRVEDRKITEAEWIIARRVPRASTASTRRASRRLTLSRPTTWRCIPSSSGWCRPRSVCRARS